MKTIRQQDLWYKQLVQRRLIAISGLLAFLCGSALLSTAERTIGQPDWLAPIQSGSISQIFFWFLLVYGLTWILISFFGLWKLARSVELQDRIEAQWWSQQPMIIQIVVFVEHWIFATVYVFLTGDLERGVVLAFVSILHIVLALLFAPRLLQA